MITSRKVPLIMIFIWLVSTLFWWALAFVPITTASPDWLEAAKSACFGTLPNGLPDTFGWMTLILGPLSLVLGLYVVWSQDIKTSFKDLLKKPWGIGFVVGLALVTSAEATYIGGRIKEGLAIKNMSFEFSKEGELPETYPRTKKEAPSFSLLAQDGQLKSLGDFKGQIVLLTFAFAHCQTICPVIVRQTLDAMENEQGQVVSLIVTLDPWRDTPSSLPTIAKKWELPPNAYVLSGEVDQVLNVLDMYNIPRQRDKKTGDISHPALSYIIDPLGQIAYTFNNAPSHWIVEANRRLMAENAQ